MNTPDPAQNTPSEPKLLDQLRARIRLMHFSIRTETQSVQSKFPNLWGDIPNRPFFPDAARGLPTGLSERILSVLSVLSEALMGGKT